jgi:FKBP-type peptidyl-prolyl cis-trans isomerase 2
MPIKRHDFVELNYTGKLKDGTVFDTTIEATAKEHHLDNDNAKFKPITICVGENQIIPGLDDEIIGKELNQEYTITIPAEKAFGRKDAKNIRMIPLRTFQKQQIMPQPGLQVNIDGSVATILRVSGGRIMVDFNHPLAGKEITYTIMINREIRDKKKQIESYLSHVLPMPSDTSLAETTATVTTKQALPKQITDQLSNKLQELTKIAVEFKESKGAAEPVEKGTTEDSVTQTG